MDQDNVGQEETKQLDSNAIFSQRIPPYKKLLHKRRYIIGFSLAVVVFSIMFTYLKPKNPTTQSPQVTNEIPTAIPEPTSLYPSITIQQSKSLPEGWVYKSNGWCDIKAAVPPKQAPYYTPYDASYDEQRGQYDDTHGGYYWDYPDGGASSELLSRMTHTSEIQTFANVLYKSDYLGGNDINSGMVRINCVENTNHYGNSEMLIYLSNALTTYNKTPGGKGMYADQYQIEKVVDMRRWGHEVADVTVKAHYNNRGGDPIEVKKQITLFATDKYLYEIAYESQFANPFIIETAKEIFDRLVIGDVTIEDQSALPISYPSVKLLFPMVCKEDKECGGGCMRCDATNGDCMNICRKD